MKNDEYKFSAPIQIRMSDMDPFGHVNNGVQCNYLDVGRGKFFEYVFQENIDWLNLDLVLVHLEFDFIDSIEYENDLVCQSKVTSIGTKSFKMSQQLVDRKTGKVKTRSNCVVCGFDRKTRTSIPIKKYYKEKFLERGM